MCRFGSGAFLSHCIHFSLRIFAVQLQEHFYHFGEVKKGVTFIENSFKPIL